MKISETGVIKKENGLILTKEDIEAKAKFKDDVIETALHYMDKYSELVVANICIEEAHFKNLEHLKDRMLTKSLEISQRESKITELQKEIKMLKKQMEIDKNIKREDVLFNGPSTGFVAYDDNCQCCKSLVNDLKRYIEFKNKVKDLF